MLLGRFDAWEYEEFIEEADQLIKDYPEAAAELDPLIMHSYETLARTAIDEDDLPAMQALKDKLTELTSSGRFNFGSTVSWLGDTIQHTELTRLFQTLADKLVPLIKAGNRAAVFDTIRSEFISAGGSARMLVPSAEVVEYHYPLYSKPDETGKNSVYTTIKAISSSTTASTTATFARETAYGSAPIILRPAARTENTGRKAPGSQTSPMDCSPSSISASTPIPIPSSLRRVPRR